MALTLQIKVETSCQHVSIELQITDKFIYLLNTSRTIVEVQETRWCSLVADFQLSTRTHSHSSPWTDQKPWESMKTIYNMEPREHCSQSTEPDKVSGQRVWSKNSEEVLSDQRNGSGRLTVLCFLFHAVQTFLQCCWSFRSLRRDSELFRSLSVGQTCVHLPGEGNTMSSSVAYWNTLTSNRPDRRNRSGCRRGRHHIHTPGRVQSGRWHLDETHGRQTDEGAFKNTACI